MRDISKNYIDGAWVDPSTDDTQGIVNPATGSVSGRLALSTAEDVDLAVSAARRAFASYSQTGIKARAALLNRIADGHAARAEDMAQSITADIGMPVAYTGVDDAEHEACPVTALGCDAWIEWHTLAEHRVPETFDGDQSIQRQFVEHDERAQGAIIIDIGQATS